MDAVLSAIRNGDVKSLQASLPQVTNMDAYEEGFTCLHKAVQSGIAAAVVFVLSHGANANLLSSQGTRWVVEKFTEHSNFDKLALACYLMSDQDTQQPSYKQAERNIF